MGAQPAERPRPRHESQAAATPRQLSFRPELPSLYAFPVPLPAAFASPHGWRSGSKHPPVTGSPTILFFSHIGKASKPSCSLLHLPWPPVRGPERALQQARRVTSRISAAASCPKKGHGRKPCSCSSRERPSPNRVQQRTAGGLHRKPATLAAVALWHSYEDQCRLTNLQSNRNVCRFC